MQISTNWLNYILNLNQINLTELKERLTLAGFEVEETKTIKVLKRTDVILDLAATTNRPDILSIAGIVNEITSLIDGAIQVDPKDAKEMARRAASEEGMLIGISSGATLAAIAQKLSDLPAGSRVLGFNYDTGERYLSVPDFLPVE